MPDKDVLDWMVVKGVVERQCDAAGISEDAVHVFAQQTVQQNGGTGQSI
jgi:hypothetical protein